MTPNAARLESALESIAVPSVTGFRVGSWTVNLHASRDELRIALAGLFRLPSVQFLDVQPPGTTPALYLLHRGFSPVIEALIAAECSPGDTVPDDGYVTGRDRNRGVFALRTQVVHAVLVEGEHPPRICLILDTGTLSAADFSVHLSFVFNTMLFALGRVVLHAGAVSVEDRGILILGERGAGKSTTCLRMGASGATILSDDHTVLSRDGGQFFVSGCDGYARVTEKTETRFLASPLDIEPQSYAGLLKKEFLLDSFFRTVPNRDYPLAMMLFLSMGDRFELRELGRHEAVPAFISTIRNALRFNNPRDLGDYLDYVSDLMRQIPVSRVQLSPDLDDLDRLVSFVQQHA